MGLGGAKFFLDSASRGVPLPPHCSPDAAPPPPAGRREAAGTIFGSGGAGSPELAVKRWEFLQEGACACSPFCCSPAQRPRPPAAPARGWRDRAEPRESGRGGERGAQLPGRSPAGAGRAQRCGFLYGLCVRVTGERWGRKGGDLEPETQGPEMERQ